MSTPHDNEVKKVIFYYEDMACYEMLNRCFLQYLETENVTKLNTESVVVYSNDERTAYFLKNKSGSIRGKCWNRDSE